MALTFPLSTAAFADLLGIVNAPLKLNTNRELSGMGSGQTLEADLSPELWIADVSTRSWRASEARRHEALINAIVRSMGTFYLYDPRKAVPRLDPGGAILSGQNLLSWSEEFDNASWTKGAMAITTNAAVSPDGTTTMDKLVADTSNANHSVRQNVNVTEGVRYTFSVYAKAAEFSRLQMALAIAPGGQGYGFFNLIDETASVMNGADTTVELVPVENGIYRCAISVTAANTAAGPAIMWPRNNSNTTLFAGDGSSGLHVWGAQLEPGSVATEYRRREATPGAWNVQINSLPDAKSMSLKGLPPGYKLSTGDYLSFDYGNPARRAFHELAEDVTANGSGVTPAFEVSPFIRTGADTNLAVTLVKPTVKVKIVPGSLDSKQVDASFSQLAFSVVQKL